MRGVVTSGTWHNAGVRAAPAGARVPVVARPLGGDLREASASYEALLARALEDPEALGLLERDFTEPAAALVVGFTGSSGRLAARGPALALAHGRALEHALRGALAGHGPRFVRRLRDGVLAVLPSPQAALLAALDGVAAVAAFGFALHSASPERAHRDPFAVGVGLGWGALLLDPAGDASGLEVNAAFALAGAAQAGEVLATDPFLAALGSPPPGVGLHRARADRVHHLGLPFSVMLDYRS